MASHNLVFQDRFHQQAYLVLAAIDFQFSEFDSLPIYSWFTNEKEEWKKEFQGDSIVLEAE